MVAAETYVGEGLASGTSDLTTRIAKINLSVEWKEVHSVAAARGN